MTFHFALAALVFIQAVISQVIIKPGLEPLCDGIRNTGPGGMFGYSISLSKQQNSTLTWMAIGKPWDSSVHVYSAVNPDLSELVRNVSHTGGNEAIEPVPLGEWSVVTLLGDTNNGTYPNRMQSLFGYSVSLSEDGSWLAVGIPARSSQSSSTLQLQMSPYNGAVRIYRRLPNTTYTLVGEIQNPNQYKFWDKFGSKVQLTSDAAGSLWLVVAANAGWDGASVDYFGTPLTSPRWPRQPVTDVSRAGLYVYKMSFLTDTTDIAKLFNFIQFIPQKSSVPMGSLGIDFDLSVLHGDLQLLVRDFDFPSGIDMSNTCPAANCSYVVVATDGKQITVNSTGILVEYKLKGDVFLETNRVQSLDFPKSEKDMFPRNSWERSDWFGVGVSIAFDEKYGQVLMAAGAPRDATGVFTYYKEINGTTWKNGNFIVNDEWWRKSFYGQRVIFSPDGRFLFVADPIGSADSLGQGLVKVYHRRSQSEVMYPLELNEIPLEAIAINNNVPYRFDRLGSFSKGVKNSNEFRADNFGLGMDANSNYVVIGAPIEGCVYTFAAPMSIDLPTPPAPPGIGNYTIPSVTPTIEVAGQNQTPPTMLWLYILVALIAAFLLTIPVAVFYLKRRHKQQLLKELKAKADIAMSEDQLAGTRENLAEVPGSVEDSRNTLNNGS